MSVAQNILKDKSKSYTVIPVLLFGLFVPFAAMSFNIAFPVITKELGLSTVHSAWIPSAYLIAGAIIGLPISRISRRIGDRTAFVAGIITYSAGAAAVALSGEFRLLALSFFAMGSGAAVITLSGRSLLYSVCDREERETVYGLLISAVSIGTLAGNFLGGALIHFLSWRVIFGASAVLGLVSILITGRKIHSAGGDPTQKNLDLTGALFYALFITAFLVGFSNFPSEAGYILIPFSLLMLYAFGRYETRVPSPILRIELFRENREFRFSSLTMVMRQCSTDGIWFLMSFYLQHVCSITPLMTGLILGSSSAVTAIVSPFSGKLAGKIGDTAMIALGLLVNTAALVLLAFIEPSLELARVLGVMVLLGVSAALVGAPSASLIMDNVADEHRSMASATLNLARKMGKSLSMGTVMLLFSVLLGSVHLSGVSNDDFMGCMHLIMLIFVSLSAVSWIYAFIHRRRNRYSN